MNSNNDFLPIVMTLDAGGTNFVFSAMQGVREVASPFTLPSHADNLHECLRTLVSGFERVRESLPAPAAAISFAFPGPADYRQGIICNLPNFPAFSGATPLGPYLQEWFGIPVYIANDGNLFAYGEACAGLLPEVNRRLEETGSPKRFHNLLGFTLGTGFGCGVVTDGRLLTGDNDVGGDVWCLPGKRYPDMLLEESVSIRAVKRVYSRLTGDTTELTPKDIFDIAEGNRLGDAEAARHAFAEMGEMAGYGIATAVTLIDGLVVIGGGISRSHKYFMPALLGEMRRCLGTFAGSSHPRVQSEVFSLDTDMEDFVCNRAQKVSLSGSAGTVYDPLKRIGVGITRQGTSRSISIGAYMWAIDQMARVGKA
ncbi:MAG: ROK family protein [Prevotella sp.]|nr:ROK family protein [Prevotella sp.]